MLRGSNVVLAFMAKLKISPVNVLRVNCSTLPLLFNEASWKRSGRSERKPTFILLVDQARAGSEKLRQYLGQKLESLKKEESNLGLKFKQQSASSMGDELNIYYSHWQYGAIHMLLTIPNYQNIRALAKRLECPDRTIHLTLKTLAQLGLVEPFGKSGWRATKKNVHLARENYMNAINNANWRERARQSAFRGDFGRSVHYTALYSLSKKDADRLQQLLLDFIDETRAIVIPSKEEELICFACDLFRV